ncbi:gas vesicle protein [Brachybacterium sp. GCM10030267]|uniref:gas vesicle protein GvpO n=1 Tax=Brachybacterium sp. GCM10030267 TaxID=3273381 RepID=UPI003617746E
MAQASQNNDPGGDGTEDEKEQGRQDRGSRAEKKPSGRRRRKKVLTAKGAVRRSTGHLAELTGRVPESVIAVERQEDGWKVSLEFLESRRVPDTTDILAEYSVYVDDRGELTSYKRESRYTRGRVES